MSDQRKGKPSCSEAHRIIACPGYLSAKNRWDHIPYLDNAMTQSGTDTHEAIECMIDGKPVEIALSSIEEYVAKKCAYMQDEIIMQLFGDLDSIKEHWVKTRLWLRHDDEEMMSGEPDYFGYDGNGTWILVDYKRGPKPVPVATSNWQIQSYCALLFDDDRFRNHKVDKVYGAILQPLVSTKPIIVEMTVDQALSIRRQLLTAIWNGENSNMPRIPGDHCTYCPVRHRCPQAQSFGLVLLHKFEADNSMSDKQLLEIYPKLSQIEEICKRTRDLFKQRVAEGKIEGYEIYDHPSGHTVNKPEDLWALVKDVFGDGKEFSSLLTAPIGKIREVWVEKTMKSAQGSLTKAEAEDAWRDMIEPQLIAKPPQKRVRKKREG